MSTLRERTGGYLREAPGGVNLEKIAVYGALLFAGYLLFKSWRAGKAIVGGAQAAAKAATKPIADAYVAATHTAAKMASGITYLFPDGSKVPAAKTSPAGGGRFYYKGALYKPYAATPPGSGIYSVKRA